MLLNEYLSLFRKALGKIEDYGFSDSIEVREEIRANKVGLSKNGGWAKLSNRICQE
jgi:hypothetical protein